METVLNRFEEIIKEFNNLNIIEFGACDGYHTNIMVSLLKKYNKQFTYHLFEPCEYLISRIKHNNRNNLEDITIFNNAIGEKDETKEFWISSGQKIVDGKVVDNYYGSSSIRKPKHVLEAWKDMRFEENTVECISFDTHYKKYFDSKIIDFIWADIQGAEVDLINGGTDAFKNVRYFYTEYSDSELYDGEIGLKEICRLLPDFDIVQDYVGDVLLKNRYL